MRGSKVNAALFYSKNNLPPPSLFKPSFNFNKNKEVHLKYFILLHLQKNGVNKLNNLRLLCQQYNS